VDGVGEALRGPLEWRKAVNGARHQQLVKHKTMVASGPNPLRGQWPLADWGWRWQTSCVTLLPMEGVNRTVTSGAAGPEAGWAGKLVGPD
jgi:hypothetical protein